MTEPAPPNLPAQIADALTGIPKGLTPACLKALDRLVGSVVDLPVAWLAQKKVRIEAKTRSLEAVEAAVARAAASKMDADSDIADRALDVLLSKEYRRQINRTHVAVSLVEELGEHEGPADQPQEPASAIVPDDDWLNVFERYAEDASSDRMQKLWGRVLAGEVRKPGKYSLRTLRFLSEFSQADALSFSSFCDNAFGDAAPKKLTNPGREADIRELVYMESAGLLQGASGVGLSRSLTFNQAGQAFIAEGQLAIMLIGEPGLKHQHGIVALTPLGQELVSLLPDRDARAAARRVADGIRAPDIKAAYLMTLVGQGNQLLPMEVLWQPDPTAA